MSDERPQPGIRVMISEPFAEVRSLLERAVGHLGHEPVEPGVSWRDALPEADVLVLEPSDGDGVELARALRQRNPSLPVICACTSRPSAEVEALEPIATLVKPFPLAELERALTAAVSRAVARSAAGGSSG